MKRGDALETAWVDLHLYFKWSEKTSLRAVHWNGEQDEKWGPAWEDVDMRSWGRGVASLDALRWDCALCVPDLRCIPSTQNLDPFSLWFVFLNLRAFKTCLIHSNWKTFLWPWISILESPSAREHPPLWAGNHFDSCIGKGLELGQEAGICQSFNSPFTTSTCKAQIVILTSACRGKVSILHWGWLHPQPTVYPLQLSLCSWKPERSYGRGSWDFLPAKWKRWPDSVL